MSIFNSKVDSESSQFIQNRDDMLNLIEKRKDILDLQKITGIGPVKAKSLIKDKITLPILLNINLSSRRIAKNYLFFFQYNLICL